MIKENQRLLNISLVLIDVLVIVVSLLEEIAYLKGYISEETLLKTAEELKKTDYGQYLFNLAKRGK